MRLSTSHSSTASLFPAFAGKLGSLLAVLLLVGLFVVAPARAQYEQSERLTSANVEAGGRFGERVAGIGDVNGDAVPDVAVGAHVETVADRSAAGRVYIYSGMDESRLFTLTSPNVDSAGYFGRSVEGISDVDGDGTPDVLVGASREAVSGSGDAGRVYLFSGADGSLLRSLVSPNSESGGRFGVDVSAIEDVNGDAIPDMLVGAWGEAVSGNSEAGRAYLFSGADGSALDTLVSPNVESGGRFGQTVVNAGDVDEDGIPDLLVGAYREAASGYGGAGRVYVFSGTDGSKIWTLKSPQAEFESRFGVRADAGADLNSDGVPDFIIGASTETVNGTDDTGRVYLFGGASGSPIDTLASPNPETSGLFGNGVTAAGDMTGDGTSEILVGANNETVSGKSQAGRVYLYAGADRQRLQTFTSPNAESDGRFGHEGTGIGDIDQDGRPDVIVGARGETVNGNGGAGRAYVLSTNPAPAITGLQPESGAAGTTIRIRGAGFSATSSDNTVTFGGAIATVDSARSTALYAQVPSGVEGPVDVLVSVHDTTVAASERFTAVAGGSESFAAIGAGLTGVEASSSDWGDYDGDGDLDLVVIGDTTGSQTPSAKIYQNDGSRGFSPIRAGLIGVDGNGSAEWGDYDQDGDLDLIVTGRDESDNRTTTIYRNEGGESFAQVGAGLTGVAGGSTDWGDFDGDGDLDLIMTGRDGDLNRLTTIYRNEGDGVFVPIGAGLNDVKFSSSEWGDYNGDGDLDLIVTGSDGSDVTARIYQNEGDGTFTSVSANLTGIRGGSTDWGDFDRDGDLDLVVVGNAASSGNNRTATIYRNEGDGMFSPLGASLTGVRRGTSVEWGDYDGDGDLDLVVTGSATDSSTEENPTTTIYRNEGNGSFTPIDTNLTGVLLSTSNWGDYDGDGDLDLVLTGRDNNGNPIAKIYRNGGADVTAPDAPKNLAATPTAADTVTVSWTASDSADVESYRVYRDTAPIDSAAGPDSLTALGTVPDTDTAYADTTVATATTYHYRATAVDSAGNECGFSNEDTATPVEERTGFTTIGTLNGNTYYLSEAEKNWLDAKAQSEAEGGHLATITSQEESDLISSYVMNQVSGSAWIGFTDRETEGVWKWVTGEEVTITNWNDGEPNDEGGEDAADIWSSTGKWNDNGIENSNPFILEVPAFTPPEALTATAGAESVDLSWTPTNPANATDGYNVYRATSSFDDPANATKLNSTLLADTSYTDAEVTGGTTYHYRVSAVDTAGNESGFSNEATATPTPPPLHLTTMQPTSGAAGTTVRIYGSGFDPTATNNTVMMGGTEAPVDSVKPGMLYARVPSGPKGPVEVSVTRSSDNATATASGRFMAVTGGSDSFAAIGAGLTGVNDSASDWGDYDNDGDLDLVVTGDTTGNQDVSKRSPVAKIYQNNGLGRFTPIGAGLIGVLGGGSADWGDYDQDGDLDLIVTGRNADGNPLTQVYENTGDGTFSKVETNLVDVWRGSSTSWGDYDRDGDLDVVVAGLNANDTPVARIYENDNGTFSAIGASLEGIEEGTVEWGDFDSDGDLDLLAVGETGANEDTARIYENQGGNTFTSIGANLTGIRRGGSQSSSWGDYDRDGDLDLVVTGFDDSSVSRTATIYRNDGGTFSRANAGLTGVDNGSVDWGDFDGDGNLDLVVAGETEGDDQEETFLYQNDGSGSFTKVDVGLTGVEIGSADWGDVDGDGDLDLIATGFDGNGPSATIYRNGGDDVTAPDAPTNLTATPTAADTVTVSWTASDSPDVAKYHVYRDTAPIDSSAGPGSYAAYDTTAVETTAFTDTSVTTGQTYYYRVTAVDSSGNESAFSNQVMESPLLALEIPVLAANANEQAVQLRWTSPVGTVQTYRLYRASGTFTDTTDAQRIARVSDTVYTDRSDALARGNSYHYRVLPVGTDGTVGTLSDEIVVELPPRRVAAETSISFGDATEESNYRPVALPGGETVALSDVMDGTPGADGDYRAYRETGAGNGQDYTVEECGVDDGADCSFGPGAGLWLLVKEGWSPPDSLSGVSLSEEGTYSVSLHSGWNLVSNPFSVDVSWSAVQDATGPGLSSLYERTSGGDWRQAATLAAATSGAGYYAKNEGDLDQMVLPHPTATDSVSAKENEAPVEADSSAKTRRPAPRVALGLYVGAQRRSRVSLQLSDGARTGLDSTDVEAPPSPFASATLRAVEESGEQSERLLRSARPVDRNGQRFPLRLTVAEKQTLTLRADSLRLPDRFEAVLVERPTGRTHDLRRDEAVLQPESGAQDLMLLVGTAAYVEDQQSKLAPDELTLLGNYPNPVTRATTIEYAIPESRSVRLALYDILGRRVHILVNEEQRAGFHRLQWDATGLASGVYFYRVRAGEETKVKKMTVVR